jgi:hypothetical protein
MAQSMVNVGLRVRRRGQFGDALGRTSLDGAMARRPTTVDLSEDVLARAAALAKELGQPLEDVIEAALVEHLGRRAIAEMRGADDLNGEEALELAYAELRAARRERRRVSE